MKKFNEIRLDHNGDEDDIVIQCNSIHLERMDMGYWSLLVHRGDRLVNLQINSETPIEVEMVENELGVKVIKQT